jgi:hypothetical protein
MNTLNKYLPVTSALKIVLSELRITPSRKLVYSDVRKKGRAVGVKFVGLWLSDKEKLAVKSKMEELGYTHHYIRYNNNTSWTQGTRFCFSA